PSPATVHSFPTRRSSDLADGHELGWIRFSRTFSSDRIVYAAAEDALFRSDDGGSTWVADWPGPIRYEAETAQLVVAPGFAFVARSEEHTSELQSRGHLVC